MIYINAFMYTLMPSFLYYFMILCSFEIYIFVKHNFIEKGKEEFSLFLL